MLRSTTACLGLVLAASACAPGYAPPKPLPPDFRGRIFHRFDFEAGEAGAWTQRKLPRHESLAIIADPLHAAGSVARFVLNADDPIVSDGRRAELQLEEIGRAGDGLDHWYGFRTLLPEEWGSDTEYEVLAQWKGRRDAPAEESKSPALTLRSRGSELYITNRWDERRITPHDDSPNETVWRGSLVPGDWVQWVVHVRWSYRDDGLLRVWKDRIQIVEKSGPNTYNDPRGMYFKIGIYKPPWDEPVVHSKVERRTVYHDDVWVGVGE